MRCLSSRGLSTRLKNAVTQQRTRTEIQSALAKAGFSSSRTSASSCSLQIQAAAQGSANVSTQVNWSTLHTSLLTVVPTTWLLTQTIRNCWSRLTEAKVSHPSASFPSKICSLKQYQQRVLMDALTVSLRAQTLEWTISKKQRQLNMLSSSSSLVTRISIKSSTVSLRKVWSKPYIIWIKRLSMWSFRYSQQEAFA